MFAVIVAGRPVQTNCTEIDTTHVLFALENMDTVNHVVVFLTGQMSFPDGFGGGVGGVTDIDGVRKFGARYLVVVVRSTFFELTKIEYKQVKRKASLPFSSGGPGWTYLGYIANDKPSVIFRITDLKTADRSHAGMLRFGQPSHLAQIGIAVEPLATLLALTSAAGSAPQLIDSFSLFSQKMLESFCNFASSFAVSPSSAALNLSESYVPLSCVQKWYENFVRRMSLDPNFWRSGGRVVVSHWKWLAELSCQMLKVIEFYAGIGGLKLAIQGAGVSYESVAAFEIDTCCTEVYRHNFPHDPINRRNIMSLTAEELEQMAADLWLMSPPCQPFTRNGLQRGIDDPRTDSFLHLISVFAKMERTPDYLFVENVKGFEESEVCRLFQRTLCDLGYYFKVFHLSPTSFGIPNSRLRFYIIARKNFLGEFTVDDVNERTDDVFRKVQASESDATKLVLLRQLKLRFFAPAEIQRLMGFEESFGFPSRYTPRKCYQMLGNSVNVSVITYLLRLLLKI